MYIYLYALNSYFPLTRIIALISLCLSLGETLPSIESARLAVCPLMPHAQPMCPPLPRAQPVCVSLSHAQPVCPPLPHAQPVCPPLPLKLSNSRCKVCFKPSTIFPPPNIAGYLGALVKYNNYISWGTFLYPSGTECDSELSET